MFLGIIFVTGVSFYLLKFLYRNEKLDNPDPPELAELKREIYIWQRTKNSIHPAVRDLGFWAVQRKSPSAAHRPVLASPCSRPLKRRRLPSKT
jgi:hypothetical protein